MTSSDPSSFGANSWLVEEMFEQYRLDPDSVGETWREFFSDFTSEAPAPKKPAATTPAATAPVAPAATPTNPVAAD
ncbi:MAG: hypothetical protein KGR47_10240, partial [Acidobacteria bacterium]|nr:hypothetical protein [Acidobacteriota bacterium]